eukprot:5641531-Pleurochrysis_carterae.AAC.2
MCRPRFCRPRTCRSLRRVVRVDVDARGFEAMQRSTRASRMGCCCGGGTYAAETRAGCGSAELRLVSGEACVRFDWSDASFCTGLETLALSMLIASVSRTSAWSR